MGQRWGLSLCQSVSILQKVGAQGAVSSMKQARGENSVCQPGAMDWKLPFYPVLRVTSENLEHQACMYHTLLVESKFTLPTRSGRATLRSSQNTFPRAMAPVGLGRRLAGRGAQTAPLRAPWGQRSHHVHGLVWLGCGHTAVVFYKPCRGRLTVPNEGRQQWALTCSCRLPRISVALRCSVRTSGTFAHGAGL